MKRNGFSLIELLIVTGIGVVLLGTAALYLGNTNRGIRLDHATDELVTLLRTAQGRAVGQEQGTRWGVYIDNTNPATSSYSLFSVDETLVASTTYAGIPGTSTEQLALLAGLQLTVPASGQVAQSIFAKSTGLPATTTVIVIETASGPPSERTISVETNGRIDYQ